MNIKENGRPEYTEADKDAVYDLSCAIDKFVAARKQPVAICMPALMIVVAKGLVEHTLSSDDEIMAEFRMTLAETRKVYAEANIPAARHDA